MPAEARLVRRMDELAIIARTRHPNLVPILDLVSSAESPAFVTEPVPGEALADLLRSCQRAGRRAPPDVVVAILGGILAGLHVLHEAASSSEIVHLGVSTDRVIVGRDGLARLRPPAVTSVEIPAEYQAPEQLAGRPVHRRMDVFSAGVVAFEALTGQRPVDGRTPSELVPGLPPPLDTVVSRALSVDPAERQATAAAFAADLAIVVKPATPDRVASWVLELSNRRASNAAPTAPGLLQPLPGLPPRVVIVAPPAARGSWLSRLVVFLLVGGLVVGTAWYLIHSMRRDVTRSMSLEQPGTQSAPALPERLRRPLGSPTPSH